MNFNVKIIILNWNGEDILLDCLESVSAIDYDNFEIIVIDNGSTDQSIKSIHDNFPEVQVIALNKNYGYAKAHNKAFDLMGYKEDVFFMLLNNDTIVDKNILSHFTGHYQKLGTYNPSKPSILIPSIYYAETMKPWCISGQVNLKYGIIRHKKVIGKNKEYSMINLKNYATGCCMFTPANVFKKLEGFDDRFFMYCEDVDFSLRAHQEGIGIFESHKAELWHKVSYSLGGTYSCKKMLFKLSSLLKLYNKHLKWHIRYFSFLLLLLRMLISGIRSYFSFR